MTALIISDLHLGCRNSQVGPLCQILDTHFDRLILNGDVINGLNLKKLKLKHWRVVDRLRNLACKREVVLIRGNHDAKFAGKQESFGPADVLGSLLGVPLQEDLRLTVGDRHYLVMHGDRFDPTVNWPVITDAADVCYRTVQGVNQKAAKWLKRGVKQLGGAIEFVTQRAVEYARKQGCHGIITGHTHFADDRWVGGIHYLNGGSWVDWPCTYVEVNGADIELKRWAGSRTGVVAREPQVLDYLGVARMNGVAASAH